MDKIEKTANSKITITDEELADLESLAAYLDGNATPEESEAIEDALESDDELRDTVETFEFMQQYESEIESVFGEDGYAEDLERFESALRQAAASANETQGDAAAIAAAVPVAALANVSTHDAVPVHVPGHKEEVELIDLTKIEKRKKLIKKIAVVTPITIAAAAAAIFFATPGHRDPVYVYKDFGSAENSFTQSFFMGDNYENIPPMNDAAVGFDSTGIEAEINFDHNAWGGYYFTVSVIDETATRPATGNDNAGINLAGARRLSFYAKGLEGGEQVEFFTAGLGYGEDFTDKYPDSSRKISLGYVQLTTEWTKYEIDVSGHDLSRVAGGFGWVSSQGRNAERTAIRFRFDEVRFEFDDKEE
ncbi:MAG: hypothetical protein LBS42_01385 [Tannerella sp.]|jgi:hypothetical protein|nr:hypothetical protein [Tannerella sp.]